MLTSSRKIRDKDQDIENLTFSNEAYFNVAFELGEDDISIDSSRFYNDSQVPKVRILLPSLPENGKQNSDSDESDPDEEVSKPKKDKDHTMCTSVLWISCVSFTIIFPLVLLSMGLIFSNSCSSFLPVMLVTTGAVMSLGNAFNLMCGVMDSGYFRTFRTSSSVTHSVAAKGNLAINITTFLLWFILLTWITFVSRPNASSSLPEFVNSTDTSDSLIFKNKTEMSSGIPVDNETQLLETIFDVEECSQFLFLFSRYLVNCLLIFLTCVAVIHILGFLGVFTVCSVVVSKVKLRS